MFSQTELYILECLASGYSKQDIIEELNLSGKGLPSYFNALRHKLNMPKATQHSRDNHAELCQRAALLFTKKTTEMYVINATE